MAVVGLTPILHEHVGVRLEERDELLCGRHRLFLKHASLGLVHDLRHARQERRELRAEARARRRHRKALQVCERAGRVARRGRGALQQVAVAARRRAVACGARCAISSARRFARFRCR